MMVRKRHQDTILQVVDWNGIAQLEDDSPLAFESECVPVQLSEGVDQAGLAMEVHFVLVGI